MGKKQADPTKQGCGHQKKEKAGKLMKKPFGRALPVILHKNGCHRYPEGIDQNSNGQGGNDEQEPLPKNFPGEIRKQSSKC